METKVVLSQEGSLYYPHKVFMNVDDNWVHHSSYHSEKRAYKIARKLSKLNKDNSMTGEAIIEIHFKDGKEADYKWN